MAVNWQVRFEFGIGCEVNAQSGSQRLHPSFHMRCRMRRTEAMHVTAVEPERMTFAALRLSDYVE